MDSTCYTWTKSMVPRDRSGRWEYVFSGKMNAEILMPENLSSERPGSFL